MQLYIPSDLQNTKIDLVNDKVSVSFFVDEYENAAHNDIESVLLKHLYYKGNKPKKQDFPPPPRNPCFPLIIQKKASSSVYSRGCHG